MAKLITLFGGEIPEIQYFDSNEKALKELDRFLKDSIKKGHRVEKQGSRPDAYEITTLLGDIYIYVEEDKVSAKTINNQSKPNYQQTKTKTVMANSSKGLRIGTTKSGKAVYGNAKVSSAYRATGTKNKKPAMVVPVGYVTLPSPFYTFGRKHQNLGKQGGYERVRTYVIGATITKNGKKMYIVAQLTYMGGKPAVAENRYKGYSRYTAWAVFNELRYTNKSIKDAKGKWKDSKSDGTSASAVQEAIAIRRGRAAARANAKK